MTTAQDIIDLSSQKAGILAQGQTLEAGINTQVLTTLNNMLNRWKNDGANLGLPALLAADTIIVDDADEEAIELNLRLRILVDFRRPIQPGLSEAGRQAFTELQAKYSNVPIMELDPALTRKYLPRKGLNGSTS